jgi:hypothetical protein
MPDPVSLLPQLRHYLSLQRENEDVTASDTGEPDDEASPVWPEADGQTVRPVLISHYDRGALIVTGVAVLAFDKNAPFTLPTATALSISQFYVMKGATSMMQLAD